MKLFELYEQPVLTGANNLTSIANADKNKTGATIRLGAETYILEHATAAYIYKLYESAVAHGTQDTFLQGLSEPKAIMENDNTMRHIIGKFKHEVKNFVNGDELSDDLYHALYDYYSDHGEMPYGVAKGRDGDPYEWVHMRFDRDVNDYTSDGEIDVPALPGARMPTETFSALGEAEKKRNPWLDLAYKNDSPKPGEKKRTSSGEVEYTKSGQIHRSTKRYGGDEPENVKDDEKSSSGEEGEKRGRGRPRTRPLPDANAPRRGRGRPRKNPAPDANAPKRGRGRPKKVREWIETLRHIVKA
jgi:hypothetical protein